MVTVVVEEEDEVEDVVADVVAGDSTDKNEMLKETKIEVSNQGELEELKTIKVVRTDGNKVTIKVMNVTTVARSDIMQEIVGLRKLKEMLQLLQRMKAMEKKIGNSKLLSLWRK